MDKDLISLAEDLLSKVKSFTNNENNFNSSYPSSKSELFHLLAQYNIFHQTADKKWHHTSLSATMTQPRSAPG